MPFRSTSTFLVEIRPLGNFNHYEIACTRYFCRRNKNTIAPGYRTRRKASERSLRRRHAGDADDSRFFLTGVVKAPAIFSSLAD
jgi:hypothetical protein